MAQRDAGNDQSQSSEEEDPCVDPDDMRNCWTIDPITGIRYYQPQDSSHIDLADRQTMSGMSMGLVHTGNLFSPHHITSIFDQRPSHDFLFVNAYQLFAHRPEDVMFWDTRIPYTNVSYFTSGSNLQSNDRLKINFAGNLNSSIGLGTKLDYVYARGEYISQATKPLNWTSYLYYNSDQYKAYLTYNLSKLANQENGGIADRGYVLYPDSLDDYATDPRTMPVNLTDTWNDMDAWNVHLTHSYDLGRWDEVVNPEDTTDIYDEFTSVASIFHSVDVQSYKHLFRMDEGADQSELKDFFRHRYISRNYTQDSTAYLSFSTYAGIRVNEGFSKWSQFGLSAFVGYEHQSFSQSMGTKLMTDTLQWVDSLDFKPLSHSRNSIFIGGQLSRHLSRRLTFDVTAKLCIFGEDKQGDFDVSGNLQTIIPAGKNDSITVLAKGYWRQQSPSYMLNTYHSNHFWWDNDFESEQRLHLEGLFKYSLTGTEAKIGLENITDYIYFDESDYKPHQADNMLQIFSGEFTQRLKWRAINFDNTVLVQSSTDPSILPLPNFVWRSDLSLRFVIAHTLTTQLGCTCHYFSKYYAPTYQPATQQFAVQDKIECGDYPLFNAYINCNLKRLKFFFMYSGVGTNFWSNDTFHMPYYPLQSSRMEYGVVFDLQN